MEEPAWLQKPIPPYRFYNLAPPDVMVPVRRVIASFREFFFTFGSCFASHIALHLTTFAVEANYCRNSGFHYNTRTLLALLCPWKAQSELTQDDLYRTPNAAQPLYHHDIRDSGPNAINRALERLETTDSAAIKALENAQFVITTPGTPPIS